MASSSVAQPEWHKPQADAPVLKMNNSMTHTKTEFIPAKGKQVNWYTCGPTVYDKSHLGHARNYITFDIIRRIMEDYFSYDVNFVMNITDIDDKIIITARSQYLFNNKKASTSGLSQDLISEVEKAWREFVEAKLGKYLVQASADNFAALVKTFEDGKGPSLNDEPKFQMWMKATIRALKAIDAAKAEFAAGKGKSNKESSDILLEEVRDVFAPALDKALKHTVTDHQIFRDFTGYWERDYFKDMDALNVRRPDVLTRVSEYVPEIIAFVEGIIKNGYAIPNHSYAKLEPWSASNMKLVQEGEGDLTASGEKKSSADFALWKASKAGEPAWDSPWGAGRPGWHIECSAMAGDVIGANMDIHSGGIDLAFPHHDNELAQSEAHYNCKQWVNYFLHAGHLHAEGQKMSKSLKNFDSIADALKEHTAAQIRIMFLLHSWDSVLDYKQASLQEARVFEAAINNFLVNVKSIVQALNGNHNFHQAEKDVYALFQQKQEEIHAALCDNFDTSRAMFAIRDMITATNTYLKKASTNPSIAVLVKVSKYVTKMMRTFGVFKDENPEIGFTATGSSGGSVEEVAGPYVRLIASFRDRVRELARRKDSDGAALTELLQLCDKIRDEELVDLNVALDDREDGKALVKFVDREVILKQREEKRVAAARAAAEKEAKKAAAAAAEAEKLAKGKIHPSEMFKDEEGRKLYSAWDDKGIPTKKIDGEEVGKGGAKKLVKQQEAQAKLHERYLASLKQ
ncbi:tRNA synthetases class I (C) catalytic domain-containing protein [Obelidium mucronatum]|nr:tRNA synthetases class I (C) catalytic domain-containing protein [Obelidium mucronatum]